MESKSQQMKVQSSYKPGVIIKNITNAYEYSLGKDNEVLKDIKKVHFLGIGDASPQLKPNQSIRKTIKAKVNRQGRGDKNQKRRANEIIDEWPEDEVKEEDKPKVKARPQVGQSYREPQYIKEHEFESIMKTPEFLQQFFNKNNRMQIDDDRLKEIHKDWKAHCKPEMHLDNRRDAERFKPILHKDEYGVNQLFWVTYMECDTSHVKRLMDFYRKLDRTFIIITGTHGTNYGKTIFTHPIIEEQGHNMKEGQYIEDATKFFGQDFKKLQNYCGPYLRKRTSIQMVTKKQWPITYSKVDAVFAWCYSEVTFDKYMFEDPNRPGVWGPKPTEVKESNKVMTTFGKGLQDPLLLLSVDRQYKYPVKEVCLIERSKGTYILASSGYNISTFKLNINPGNLEQQASFEHVNTAKYHDDEISCIRYCNDSKRKCVYTCSHDRTIKGWNFTAFTTKCSGDTGEPESKYTDFTHVNTVMSLVCIPDVGMISVSMNGDVLFTPHSYCEDKDAKWALNDTVCNQIECLVDCEHKKYFAVGSKANILVMQYDKLDKPPIKLKGHRALITALRMVRASTSNMLFSASRDRTMKVWDLNNLGSKEMRPMHTFEGGHQQTINDIGFFAKYILTIGDDRRIQVWDSCYNSKAGKKDDPIKTIKMKGFGKKVLVHGQTLIAIGGEFDYGEVKVWQFNWSGKGF